MTALIPPPVDLRSLQPAEPLPPRRRFVPRSRRGKAAIASGLVVLLVAGLLGATYKSSPGGTLWGVQKAIFPDHAQDVALTAVVNDLKKAQDILGSGQQPTPDQLTDARTALNQAKQGLDHVSPSPERTSLQNLYLQLTQQLLQYTPDSVLRLAPLPVPPPAPPAADPQQPDAVALTSAAAPTWGYGAPDDYIPAPAGIPESPIADWPQPIDPPMTPNLNNLGYYDPSWGRLYGYNPGGWYNYDLGGYNRYGFDFLGFDRWGYDRWGYDRWGYDRWGYNWAGYNWAGYDRHGWDRNGWNEWGQRRNHPGDPRRRDWYDRHHPYRLYYQWKFHLHNPVYRRAQWDRAHGFNPDRYRDWNRHRDWHNPRNRDWAPPAPNRGIKVDIRLSSPVVNLNASLTQFISNDKVKRVSGPLMKDLADKSARDFTKELTRPVTVLTGSPQLSTLKDKSDTLKTRNETSIAPPALTAPAPATPPSKVKPGFTAPKLDPAPAYTPPDADKPRENRLPKPDNVTPGLDPDRPPGQLPGDPKKDAPDRAGAPPSELRPDHPAMTPPADPKPASPPSPEVAPPREDSTPRRDHPVREAPVQEAPAREAPAHEAPARREPAQQRPEPKAPRQAPEAPRQKPAPQPPVQTPAPAPEAPVRQAPAWQRPERQAPPQREAPVRQAPVWQQPERQAPPQREAPVRQKPERQAPPQREAPRSDSGPRQAPERPKTKGPKCSSFPMC
ncbi:hypothetical protein ABQF35_17425 [Mycobacterium syngnathidarum]